MPEGSDSGADDLEAEDAGADAPDQAADGARGETAADEADLPVHRSHSRFDRGLRDPRQAGASHRAADYRLTETDGDISSETATSGDLVESGTADQSSATTPPSADGVTSFEPSTDDDRQVLSDQLVRHGMELALNSLDTAAVIVERHDGQILWASRRWNERFGRQNLWGRHIPSSTEVGESPLPPPGQSWQRTRTLNFADGNEDLVELSMLGAREHGVEIVTIVALNRTGSGPVATDRAEVASIIDGALADSVESIVAVLSIDLDRFSVVQDLVGSVEAARLLDLVSRRIATTVRANDLMFRLPSDEFVVIANDLDHHMVAEELAERIRATIATMTDIGHDLALSASIGVAFSVPGETGDSMLEAGEAAVALAKTRGRNRIVVHDEELRTRTQRLMVVERQLREAIDRRNVGFAYQPVVDLATGRIVGSEALLRLGGEIGLSAVEVVAAAEYSGLMGTLGSLVLDGVSDQLGDLLRDVVAEGLGHQLMINLSATQLADPGLLATLDALAGDPTVPSGRLAIEVPEVVIKEHTQSYQDLTVRLEGRIRLGIDGFGTSSTSIDLLDRVNADYVKLHRSLTTSVTTDHNRADQIAELVRAVAQRGMSTIALGVEQQDQAEALLAMGCPMAQGFFYAGAVTAQDLRELMASQFTSLGVAASETDSDDSRDEAEESVSESH